MRPDSPDLRVLSCCDSVRVLGEHQREWIIPSGPSSFVKHILCWELALEVDCVQLILSPDSVAISTHREQKVDKGTRTGECSRLPIYALVRQWPLSS
jgi:hypothetical protein